MYWSTVGSDPGIFRAHMDGLKAQKLDDVVVDYPTGLAIDYYHDERWVNTAHVKNASQSSLNESTMVYQNYFKLGHLR